MPPNPRLFVSPEFSQMLGKSGHPYYMLISCGRYVGIINDKKLKLQRQVASTRVMYMMFILRFMKFRHLVKCLYRIGQTHEHADMMSFRKKKGT
jgi:hypothetical protein